MTCSSINMLPNLQSLWIRDSSPFKSNFDCLITFPTLFLLFVNLHPRIFSPISFRVKRMAVGGLGGRGRKKKNIDVWKKHQLVASYTCLKPKYEPLTGKWTQTDALTIELHGSGLSHFLNFLNGGWNVKLVKDIRNLNEIDIKKVDTW